MKVCEKCGEEIATKDGNNLCTECDKVFARSKRNQQSRTNARTNRKEKEAALRDLGLKKVRGSLGGTYWE